jgi:hypothetical protein
MADDPITISPGPQFRAAMMLALAAADDVLDLGVGAMMIHLLGWHWEFLPSFFAKLVPGVDLVPFWTIAVVNVWRKAKREAVIAADEKLLPQR